MSKTPPFETFKRPTCRGSYALGTACRRCERCAWEWQQMAAPHERAGTAYDPGAAAHELQGRDTE